MNTALAQKLAAIAEYSAHTAGRTVQLKLSAAAYLGPETDRILYKTPANEGVNLSISKALENGVMNVYVTPEDADDARRIIAELEAA